MLKRKTPITMVLLLSLALTALAPAAPAAAASPLAALFSQSAAGNAGGSGNGLIDILMGLLLGKLFGNIVPGGLDPAKPEITPAVKGAATITPLPGGNPIVATAKKYLGTSYVWGAETPAGFDCSGFTRYVMKENGITLPRTAAEQFAAGTPVDKAQLQAGDLVFFTTYKPGASHVGIYMGGGRFIHASSMAKQVAISNLDESYYAARYIGARRYTD